MRRLAIFPLLGPALVLYLIADVASSRARFDASAYLLAAVAVLLSFARRGASGSSSSRAAQVLGSLGLCEGIALLRLLSAETPRLSVDMFEAAALGALGGLVLDLALSVPDPLGPKAYRRSLRVLGYVAAAASVITACLSIAPLLEPFGEPLWVSARLAHAPAAFACFAVFAAFGLRLARRRLGTPPEALLINGWGLLGLAPAVLFSVLFLSGALPILPPWLVRGLAAACALALYAGHAFLIEERRELPVSHATRDAVSVVATIAVVALAAGLFVSVLPERPLARGAWIAATLVCALGLFALLRQGFRQAFAPDGGKLLDALLRMRGELGRAQTLETLVQMTLKGVREGTGTTWSKPVLYGFDPAFEGQIDLAGAGHLHSRPPHPLLLARLHEYPGDLIVRSELEQQTHQRPALRPLLEVVTELDVLCVVPLVVEGQLEGALIVPRGQRTALLALEEQRALWEFTRYLAGLLAVYSAKARAERRANAASLAAKQAALEIESLTATVQRLTADREILHAERSRQAELPTLVAYSAAQRALVERLKVLAFEPAPVVFIAEAGVAVEPLARLLHAQAAPDAPFVVMDCAAVRVEQAAAALFGGDGPRGSEVGCLRVAEGGILFLIDVPALPLAVQKQLAFAMSSGRARRTGTEDTYPVHTRVLVSTQRDLVGLASEGRFSVELADQLAPVVCQVPPLRECSDDVTSLVLLAIDRACRRHARGSIGLESEVLAELRAYDFPGNHAELEQLIDRAVAHARGLRLTQTDLAKARISAAEGGESLLDSPYEVIERKLLVHALARAQGNKSEAARLLGLPRRTLLDKLRRHKLDDAPNDIPRPN